MSEIAILEGQRALMRQNLDMVRLQDVSAAYEHVFGKMAGESRHAKVRKKFFRDMLDIEFKILARKRKEAFNVARLCDTKEDREYWLGQAERHFRSQRVIERYRKNSA